jgi:hypothetical protein
MNEPQDAFLYLSIANSPQTVTQSMYIAADYCSQRDSDCHVQRVTTHQIYCTNTVQTVQSPTELYLQ